MKCNKKRCVYYNAETYRHTLLEKFNESYRVGDLLMFPIVHKGLKNYAIKINAIGKDKFLGQACYKNVKEYICKPEYVYSKYREYLKVNIREIGALK